MAIEPGRNVAFIWNDTPPALNVIHKLIFQTLNVLGIKYPAKPEGLIRPLTSYLLCFGDPEHP